MTENPLPQESQNDFPESSGNQKLIAQAKNPISIGRELHDEAKEESIVNPFESLTDSATSTEIKPEGNPNKIESNDKTQTEVILESAIQEELGQKKTEHKPNTLLRLTAAALGILGALGIGGFFAEKQMDGSHGISNSAHVQIVVPENTPAKAPTESPTAASTANATSTEVSKATNTPESTAPTYGQYKTIGEAGFSPEKKAAIEDLTKGCKPMIITDYAMLCIEDSLINRPTNITLQDGFTTAAAQVHTVGLDTSKFPNALEDFNMFAQGDKYFAWVNQNNIIDVSFEQYLEEQKQGIPHPYKQRAYDGTSNTQSIKTLNGTEYPIYILKGGDEHTDVEDSASPPVYYSNEVLGDVVATGIFAPDLLWLGHTDSEGNQKSQYELASFLLSAAAQHGLDAGNIEGERYSLSLQRDKIYPAIAGLDKLLIPNDGDPKLVPPPGTDDIFNVTGTPINP